MYFNFWLFFVLYVSKFGSFFVLYVLKFEINRQKVPTLNEIPEPTHACNSLK